MYIVMCVKHFVYKAKKALKYSHTFMELIRKRAPEYCMILLSVPMYTYHYLQYTCTCFIALERVESFIHTQGCIVYVVYINKLAKAFEMVLFIYAAIWFDYCSYTLHWVRRIASFCPLFGLKILQNQHMGFQGERLMASVSVKSLPFCLFHVQLNGWFFHVNLSKQMAGVLAWLVVARISEWQKLFHLRT